MRKEVATADIVHKLPCRFGTDQGKRLPQYLVGATILRIGALADPKLSEGGGGLVIDYRPEHSAEPRRTVLSFNEIGMWVQYQGELLSDDS